MDKFTLFGCYELEIEKEIATVFAKAKPSREPLCYTIDSIEAFDIPEDKISSLEKLVFDINFAVDQDNYKNVFKENCFGNVTEAHLFLNNQVWEVDEDTRRWTKIDVDKTDVKLNDLIVAVANAIPNVKKLIIESNLKLTLKSLEAIVSNCRKLEFLKLKIAHEDDDEVRNEKELKEGIPIICRGLQNLRFLQLDHWYMNWKDARYLLLHSKQLQAVLSFHALNVRSMAQMTEVEKFLGEAKRSWFEATSFDTICFY